MNAKRFKVIFSKRRNALVVVGENASSVTKAAGTSEASSIGKVALQSFVGALSTMFLAVHCAYAEPTGGQFVDGAGAIATAGALTTIQQTTQQAIINWQSFSSNEGETIQFVQPNASAAILNRVVGSLPSELNGTLIGNGRVYLINQNGIMLGKDGMINVNGGFVGSTRDVNNDAFMKDGALVFKGESIGDIKILGKVKSEQGDIVLIANKINVKQGAELVAGEKVQLVAASEVQLTDGKITVKPSSGDKGQITVEGAIKAAQVQLLANNNNLGALAINTSGTIRATGTQTNPDGSVSIIATGEGGNINISGKTRSEKGDGNGGAVTVLADNAIRVSGTIDANSTDAAKKGGDIIIGRDIVTGRLAIATNVSGATLLSNKGFVETSGDWLATYGTRVIAKDWLLDPYDITIVSSGSSGQGGYTNITPGTAGPDINYSPSATSTILNTDIQNSLNDGTNVKITTGLAGSSGSNEGNITVNAVIVKSGSNNATLTLEAYNGITVNQRIGKASSDNASAGKLDVTMTANGGVAGSTSKGITLNNVIDANGGVVNLTGINRNATGGNANSGVVFNAGSGLAAGNFVVKGYQLGAASASNTDKNGIYFNGASILKSTGASSLEGTSNSQGNLGAGIYAETGATLTLDSGTTGTMRFVGGNSNAGYRAVRLGGGGNATIGVTGNVTFEGKAASGMPGDAVFLRANVTQQSNSTLTLKGGSVEVYADTRIAKATNATNTTLNLGDSTPAYANGVVNIGSAGFASLTADNINIVGSTSASGQQGVLIQSGSTLTANTIYVKGSALGAAGGSATAKGIHLSNGILNATNNITLDGTSTNVTGVALEAGSVTSSGAVVIKATTTVGQYQGANIGVAVSGKSVEITGNSTNERGVSITKTVTSTGGDVVIDGRSLSGNGVQVDAAITSTEGSISITGISNTRTALNLQGAISAENNVNLMGTNTATNNANAVVYMNKAVTAVNNVQINALGGNSSLTVTQATGGAISAAGLELLGSNAVYSLTNSGNAVSTLAANAKSLNYMNNKALTIDTVNTLGITATGNVSIKTTAGDITLGNNISSPSGTVNLEAADAIARTAGTINANALNLKARTSIGALTNRIQTNINSLSLDSGGSQFVTEADAVTVSARTTANNGSTDIATTSGTLTVGTVNGIAGITTNGSGNVILNGAATGGNIGLYVTKAINAGGGIDIQGKSGTTHGVNVNASALTANGPISITGTTGDANDLGVIIWQGSSITANGSSTYADGANAISIRGITLANNVGQGGRNVVINNATITNNSINGNTYIYGQNSEIALDQKSVISNATRAGAIQIVADNNAKISASLGNSTTPTAMITQNSDKGVSITSNGGGNVELANVINNGKGDVVIGAGILRQAGDGSGGQVKTNTDSKVAQSNTTARGKTYLFTGNANDTGVLAAVGGFSNGLFLSTIGTDTVNAASNTAYETSGSRNTISGGANTQVMFREKVALSGALNNATVTYGDSTSSAAVKTALQAANTGASNVVSTDSNAGTFKILNADLIDDMATGKPSVDTALNIATNKSTSGNLKANNVGYNIDITGTKYTFNTTAKLVVNTKSASVSVAGNSAIFNSKQQTDQVTKEGFLIGDNVGIVGAGTGKEAGTYQSKLALIGGDDSSNYNVSFKDAVFTINAQTYVRPPVETTILTPVSFGLAYAGGATAAGGDGVDIASACDAWSQRAGSGSISVMSLLKPNTMGLRTAKTDTMVAMSGSSASASAVEAVDSPCSNGLTPNNQASL